MTLSFLLGALPPGSRVLEVGCGRGHTAAALAAAGHDVTALDIELCDLAEAAGVRFVERDFLKYEAPPFDALAFTASLHHITPLADVIARAHALLRPGGVIIVDDFDLEAPDAATLHWYYDTQALLVAAGAYPAHRVDVAHDDILERWTHAHHHEHRLHTGAEMRAEIAARFEIERFERGPYLYRYIAHAVPALGETLRDIETRGIADGRYAAVGLQIVARHSSAA